MTVGELCNRLAVFARENESGPIGFAVIVAVLALVPVTMLLAG